MITSHPLLYLDGYQLHLRLQLPLRTHGDACADAAPGQDADDHGADAASCAAFGGQGAGDRGGQGHLSMTALCLERKDCGSQDVLLGPHQSATPEDLDDSCTRCQYN